MKKVSRTRKRFISLHYWESAVTDLCALLVIHDVIKETRKKTSPAIAHFQVLIQQYPRCFLCIASICFASNPFDCKYTSFHIVTHESSITLKSSPFHCKYTFTNSNTLWGLLLSGPLGESGIQVYPELSRTRTALIQKVPRVLLGGRRLMHPPPPPPRGNIFRYTKMST